MDVIVKSSIELSNQFQTILSITPDEAMGNRFVSGWIDVTGLGEDDTIEVEILFKYRGKIHASDIATGSMRVIQIDPRAVGIGDTYEILVRQLNSYDYKTISFMFAGALSE